MSPQVTPGPSQGRFLEQILSISKGFAEDILKNIDPAVKGTGKISLHLGHPELLGKFISQWVAQCETHRKHVKEIETIPSDWGSVSGRSTDATKNDGRRASKKYRNTWTLGAPCGRCGGSADCPRPPPMRSGGGVDCPRPPSRHCGRGTLYSVPLIQWSSTTHVCTYLVCLCP